MLRCAVLEGGKEVAQIPEVFSDGLIVEYT